MDFHGHRVIDYEAPRRPRLRWLSSVRWVVPIVSGAGAGWLLSLSGYGAVCVGIVVGFAVGTLSAAFAPRRRRLAFGLLGNGCTVVACLLSVAATRSAPLSLDDMAFVVLFLAGVVILPGLLGVALVSAIDSATRPAA